MTRVLAIVDNDTVRRRVLEAGLVLARVYRASLEALHVGDPSREPPAVEDDLRASTRILTGDVVEQIIGAIGEDDVVAASIGARTDVADPRAAGHVALEVAGRVDKPLALVPPDGPALRHGGLRVLVPLDGTELSALTIRAVVQLVAAADVDIVALHVFGAGDVPRFLDHPEYDLPVWAEEFRSRYCDAPGSRVEWRRGQAGQMIADVARSEQADAVIMGWGQELGPGRAEVVRETVMTAGVPVLLVPRAHAERTLANLPERPVSRRSPA